MECSQRGDNKKLNLFVAKMFIVYHQPELDHPAAVSVRLNEIGKTRAYTTTHLLFYGLVTQSGMPSPQMQALPNKQSDFRPFKST
ncbi:hypothetical protein Ancab_026485 [Ancistrocladus abbreviatus]